MVCAIFLLIGLEQELDPPRLCALDLPGEHAEDDDLGEPDPTYFGSHPDELEACPTGSCSIAGLQAVTPPRL